MECRGILGLEERDNKSIRILNCVVTWGDIWIEYEADQRLAKIIIREMGLVPDSKSVNTQGLKYGAGDLIWRS